MANEIKTEPTELDLKFLAMIYASDYPVNLASTQVILVEGGPEVDLMSMHGPKHAMVKIPMMFMKELGTKLDLELITTAANHFENSELMLDPDDDKMAFLTFLNCPVADEEKVAAIALKEYAHNGDFMDELVSHLMGETGAKVVKISLDDLGNPEGEFQKFVRQMDEAVMKARNGGAETVLRGPEANDDPSGTQDDA